MDSLEPRTLEGLKDDGGLMGGRWVLHYSPEGPEGKRTLLSEEGPFYDYENWPEDCRPANYQSGVPTKSSND